MTNFGIFMMVTSNGLVLGLVVYCFYRVFSTPTLSDHEHSPLQIDTHDEDKGFNG